MVCRMSSSVCILKICWIFNKKSDRYTNIERKYRFSKKYTKFCRAHPKDHDVTWYNALSLASRLKPMRFIMQLCFLERKSSELKKLMRWSFLNEL